MSNKICRGMDHWTNDQVEAEKFRLERDLELFEYEVKLVLAKQKQLEDGIILCQEELKDRYEAEQDALDEKAERQGDFIDVEVIRESHN